jgi:hypothetical protein
MALAKAVVKAVEEGLAKAKADKIAKEKAAAEKVINDKAAAPIGSTSSSYSDIGSLTRYRPVTEKETEIKSNLAGFKKGGMVVRGQGAVIRKKRAARIC